MRRAPLLVVSAVALTLALAACGSSSGSKGADTTSTSSTTRPDPRLAADRKLADAALLRPADLPGFASNPRTGVGEEDLQDLAVGIPGCEFLVAGTRDGRVHLRSPRFSRGQVRVAEDVSVDATQEQLAAQLDLYRNPAIVGCLQSVYTKAIKDRLPATAALHDVSVSPIAVDNVGDAQFGFRLTADVTENGTPQTLLSDIVGVTVGRVGVSLNVDAPDPAGLAQLETRLVPLVVRRVENAER
jgi:hypothetical protein